MPAGGCVYEIASLGFPTLLTATTAPFNNLIGDDLPIGFGIGEIQFDQPESPGVASWESVDTDCDGPFQIGLDGGVGLSFQCILLLTKLTRQQILKFDALLLKHFEIPVLE